MVNVCSAAERKKTLRPGLLIVIFSLTKYKLPFLFLSFISRKIDVIKFSPEIPGFELRLSSESSNLVFPIDTDDSDTKLLSQIP